MKSTQRSGPIEILVVDDSAISRQALKGIIEEEQDFHVRTAADPYEAVAAMVRHTPAVIVLDVEMPRMDGLTFLRKLMRQHPLPVLLCTDHPRRGLAGLELGALEVIAKPRWDDEHARRLWGAKLRDLIRDAAARPSHESESRRSAEPRHDADVVLPRVPYSRSGSPQLPLIVVGASTGGVQAIPRILADLPLDSPPIVIVQHMPERFTNAFAERLDRDPQIALNVMEGKAEDPVPRGTVSVVPGHSHGLVSRAGNGYRIGLADGPPVSRHKPSVDVLFRSAAQAAGPRAMAILLTGMGDDGARGMLEVRQAGGFTIAQDEPTCVVFGMPREAIRLGGACLILPLHRIAAEMISWMKRLPSS